MQICLEWTGSVSSGWKTMRGIVFPSFPSICHSLNSINCVHGWIPYQNQNFPNCRIGLEMCATKNIQLIHRTYLRLITSMEFHCGVCFTMYENTIPTGGTRKCWQCKTKSKIWKRLCSSVEHIWTVVQRTPVNGPHLSPSHVHNKSWGNEEYFLFPEEQQWK